MDNKQNQNIHHPLITAEHLKFDVVVYVRQSSERQVEENSGSTEYQKRLVEVALAYGWRREQIILIDSDLGRSGTEADHRPGFKRMEELITSAKVKVVIAANIARLSRNLFDSIQLFSLAARYGALLIVDYKVINPRDDHDLFVSRILGSVAEYENQIRAETMRRAKIAKAEKGEIVIPLPVGLRKLEDGTVIKNPEAKDAVELVITTFFAKRTLLATVRELREKNLMLPSKRRKGMIAWRQASTDMVRSILLNPAYAGTYVFGRSELIPGVRSHNTNKILRRPAPPERWILFSNHFPAYMTTEQQKDIQRILKANAFFDKYRSGRGSALLQGVIVCGKCGAKLTVNYGRGIVSHRYVCTYRSVKYGVAPCLAFAGDEIDNTVAQLVINALRRPPVEIFKQAVAEARRAEQLNARSIEAERLRLDRRERLLREQFENCHPRLHLLFNDLQEQLNNILKEKEQLEQRLTAEQSRSRYETTDKEIDELCNLASQVPKIWNHPLVSDRERKEIIRCLVEKVVVNVTSDIIEAAIHWESGKRTFLRLYRKSHKFKLVKELHEQGCDTHEIIERLQQGQTSTGQAIRIHIDTIYTWYQRLGLKPHSRPSWFRPLQEEATQLRDQAKTCRQIADVFNRRGLKSLSGQAWSWKLVFNLVSSAPRKTDSLLDIHRGVFRDAQSRGLNLVQMAREFNARKIPRQNKRAWHPVAIKRRWRALKGLDKELRDNDEQHRKDSITESE